MSFTQITTYVYQLICKNNEIGDRYIGFTTKYKEMVKRWRDPNVKQDKFMDFINDNGGLDNWRIMIIKKCNSREEADLEKFMYLAHKPDVYTLNTKNVNVIMGIKSSKK